VDKITSIWRLRPIFFVLPYFSIQERPAAKAQFKVHSKKVIKSILACMVGTNKRKVSCRGGSKRGRKGKLGDGLFGVAFYYSFRISNPLRRFLVGFVRFISREPECLRDVLTVF
jgi:hypothetical protein